VTSVTASSDGRLVYEREGGVSDMRVVQNCAGETETNSSASPLHVPSKRAVTFRRLRTIAPVVGRLHATTMSTTDVAPVCGAYSAAAHDAQEFLGRLVIDTDSTCLGPTASPPV
jgi:hypothetical protein